MTVFDSLKMLLNSAMMVLYSAPWANCVVAMESENDAHSFAVSVAPWWALSETLCRERWVLTELLIALDGSMEEDR